MSADKLTRTLSTPERVPISSIGLARDPANSSLLTSSSVYSSISLGKSAVVVTYSPGVFDELRLGANQTRQGHADS
jgi:hypothetical protein